MRKSFYASVGLVGLACLIYFYSNKREEIADKHPNQSVIKSKLISKRAVDNPMLNPAHVLQESREKQALLNEKLKGVYEKHFSQNGQNEIVMLYMKANLPSYENLFQSWDLDVSSQQKVLELIEGREREKWSIVSKHITSEDASKVYQMRENRSNSNSLWNIELIKLLGTQRVDDLLRVEAKAEAARAAKLVD